MVLFLTHAQPCTTPPHDKTAQKMAGSLRAGLKNWKDSAGIILVSGAFKYARAPTPISKLVSLGQNPLIVPIDELDDAGDREWEVTMVKRSSKTGFFANNYVFPGGRIDQADSSPEWLKLFHHSSSTHGNPFHPILALRDHSHSARIPLYGEVPEGPILGELAFRICAIRELFEEAGVLLVRDSSDVAEVTEYLPGTFPPAVKTLTSHEMISWRDRVHNNPEEFINLCLELQCVPDVWSLLEWCDWLTPRNLPIRYDTLFYICCIESRPHVMEDGTEIVDAQWFSPSEAIQLSTDRKILLTPPQYVEVNFLRSIGSVPCLHSYALREVLNGSVYRRTAVRILSKDKVTVTVMNEDDLYPAFSEKEALTSPPPHLPQSPNLTHIHLHPLKSPTHEYECPTHTAEELRNLSVRLYRMDYHGKDKVIIHDNVLTDKVTRHMEEYSHHIRNHDNPVTSKL